MRGPDVLVGIAGIAGNVGNADRDFLLSGSIRRRKVSHLPRPSGDAVHLLVDALDVVYQTGRLFPQVAEHLVQAPDEDIEGPGGFSQFVLPLFRQADCQVTFALRNGSHGVLQLRQATQ